MSFPALISTYSCPRCLPGTVFMRICDSCRNQARSIHRHCYNEWCHILERETAMDPDDNARLWVILYMEAYLLWFQSYFGMEEIPTLDTLQALYRYLVYCAWGWAQQQPQEDHLRFDRYIYSIHDTTQTQEQQAQPQEDDFDAIVDALLGVPTISSTLGSVVDLFIREPTVPTQPRIQVHLSPGMECSVCLNETPAEHCASLQCNHSFCKTCIRQLVRKEIPKCPLCRAEIMNITAPNASLVQELLNAL
jgi:Ring finger domain